MSDVNEVLATIVGLNKKPKLIVSREEVARAAYELEVARLVLSGEIEKANEELAGTTGSTVTINTSEWFRRLAPDSKKYSHRILPGFISHIGVLKEIVAFDEHRAEGLPDSHLIDVARPCVAFDEITPLAGSLLIPTDGIKSIVVFEVPEPNPAT